MRTVKQTTAMLAILLLAAALGADAFLAQIRRPQQTPVQRQCNPAKPLALGDFYLRKDDVTDAADLYYKKVVAECSKTTKQAGIAQYNRGVYWQKKFYILKEKTGKVDKPALAALTEAEGQFHDFLKFFVAPSNTGDLLADADFNLALVYLQKGRGDLAKGWLNQIIYKDAKQDGKIYIYRVVWSSNPNDVVDRNYDAAQMAQFTHYTIERGLSVDQVISQVKQWCRRH